MIKKLKESLKDSKKNLFLEVFLFLLVAALVQFFFQYQKKSLVGKEVCDLIQKNYIEGLKQQEFEQCLKISYSAGFSSESRINAYNEWLRQFQISHLYIYNSKENGKMWDGKSRETGIIAKNIFNKWKVINVLSKDSPIKIGDEILSINGKKVKSRQQILNTEGKFRIVRGDQKPVTYLISYSDIVYDERMTVKELNSGWGYLKIPSFKSEFFQYDELARIHQQLLKKDNFVIDVRDNFGGNFVSVIRLVSMLQCTEERVGKIFHNRTDFEGETYLKDDLMDNSQIQQVSASNPIYLKLFNTELCMSPKKVTVLMNEQTASVSELFVQILKNHHPNLKAIGSNTAGQMVLSIWYPLKLLGPSVMISIPYAWATANDKEILEGLGVHPTESVDRKDLVKFKDSLDPLLDYVLEKEDIWAESKSSLRG